MLSFSTKNKVFVVEYLYYLKYEALVKFIKFEVILDEPVPRLEYTIDVIYAILNFYPW